MDPFILQPSVPLYLDGEEICSPEAASIGGSSGEWSSSIISDTPVTVYSNRSEATAAPRKGRNKSVFMFRSQIPAPRNLRKEWTLPFEGCGKWGYLFEYDIFKYSIFTMEGLDPDLLTLPEILQKCLVIFRPVASCSISMSGGVWLLGRSEREGGFLKNRGDAAVDSVLYRETERQLVFRKLIVCLFQYYDNFLCISFYNNGCILLS